MTTAMPPEKALETDLPTIDAKARVNWTDNWNFRAYLQQNIAPRAIDHRVQRLNAEIAPRIDCTQCGNCCRVIHPYLRSKDVSRLAKGMGLVNAEFRARYLEHSDTGEQIFEAQPCPMLVESSCSVYQTRPDDCRSYPHLHKHDFLGRSVSIIENYRICPIVYNVYENLKQAFAYDPKVDYTEHSSADE